MIMLRFAIYSTFFARGSSDAAFDYHYCNNLLNVIFKVAVYLLTVLSCRIFRRLGWTFGLSWRRGRKGQRSKVSSTWNSRWLREKNEICRRTNGSLRRNSTAILCRFSSTTSSGNPRFRFRFYYLFIIYLMVHSDVTQSYQANRQR